MGNEYVDLWLKVPAQVRIVLAACQIIQTMTADLAMGIAPAAPASTAAVAAKNITGFIMIVIYCLVILGRD
jgi:hypothetical protein